MTAILTRPLPWLKRRGLPRVGGAWASHRLMFRHGQPRPKWGSSTARQDDEAAARWFDAVAWLDR